MIIGRDAVAVVIALTFIVVTVTAIITVIAIIAVIAVFVTATMVAAAAVVVVAAIVVVAVVAVVIVSGRAAPALLLPHAGVVVGLAARVEVVAVVADGFLRCDPGLG